MTIFCRARFQSTMEHPVCWSFSIQRPLFIVDSMRNEVSIITLQTSTSGSLKCPPGTSTSAYKKSRKSIGNKCSSCDYHSSYFFKKTRRSIDLEATFTFVCVCDMHISDPLLTVVVSCPVSLGTVIRRSI